METIWHMGTTRCVLERQKKKNSKRKHATGLNRAEPFIVAVSEPKSEGRSFFLLYQYFFFFYSPVKNYNML